MLQSLNAFKQARDAHASAAMLLSPTLRGLASPPQMMLAVSRRFSNSRLALSYTWPAYYAADGHSRHMSAVVGHYFIGLAS